MSGLENFPFVVGSILVPLSTGLVMLVAGRVSRPATLIGALGTLVCVAGIAHLVFQQGPVQHHIGGWGAPLGIDLYADGLSVVLLIAAALVISMSGLYSRWFFASSTNARSEPDEIEAAAQFWPVAMFLWAALHALFLSGDAFNLYVALELLGLAAVALTALGGKDALPAALRYLLASLLGSLSYLLGVALLYAEYATLDLASLAQLVSPGPTTYVAAALMTTGLALKTAVVPLHFWLPAAHSSAPAPVSAILSAVVVKATFYVLLRLWLGVFCNLGSASASQLLGWIGVVSVLWGSWMAIRQERLKLLVAYSTVAQVGYLFLVFPLIASSVRSDALRGAATFVLAHAFAKAAMFLAAGNIVWAAGHDRIADLGGVLPRLSISVAAFCLAGVSLIGMPPSGGFAAKWILLTAAIGSGQWWWALSLLVGGMLTAAYLMPIVQRAFLTEASPAGIRSVPRVMEWIAMLLALCALAVGGLSAVTATLVRSTF